MISILRTYNLYLAWVISIVAFLGSLYFSEIMEFEPCKLCWFQRICMYPLVLVLGMASYKNDRGIIPYAKALSIIGVAISLFQYLEQKVPGLQNVLPCRVDVPCSEQYINWLGFITIPFLSLVGFFIIVILLSIKKE